jgi:hypothetical protein
MKFCVKIVRVFCFSAGILFLAICKSEPSSAITYRLNGGRFGDNLLSYSRAKWLSYTYDIPLFYFPFPYSDQLMLSEYEEKYNSDMRNTFDTVVWLPEGRSPLYRNNNTLYITNWNVKVSIDWNNPDFVNHIKEMIAPRYPLETVTIPEGYISVAVHARKGGTFAADTPREKARCPLRFVPNHFFVSQLERIARMYKGKKLYVYIFTDHPNPAKIARKLKDRLQNDEIVFDYRQENNSHKQNVLEDFFSMMKFDCLIRPGSHFSRFVERLGNNHVVIYPCSVTKRNGETHISKVAIKQRTEHGWKVIREKLV